MNGGRGFGGGERRKTDRRTRRGTVRRRLEECARRGEGSPGRRGGVCAGPQGGRPPQTRSPKWGACWRPREESLAVPRPPRPAPSRSGLRLCPLAASVPASFPALGGIGDWVPRASGGTPSRPGRRAVSRAHVHRSLFRPGLSCKAFGDRPREPPLLSSS